MCRVPCLVALVLLAALPLRAQTAATGGIHGVVTDQADAVVPGVTLTATSPTVPGVFTATSDHLGRYRLGDLPPGDYTVTAELTGFARIVRSPITVRAGRHVTVDLVMQVGAIGETVEVRQEAPLLDTRSGAQAVNVSGELLRSIPLLEQREWYGALTLTPGVTTTDFAGQKIFYVHGADQTGTVTLIDGADVTSAGGAGITYLNLNADTVDDIEIQTSGLDASSPLGVGGVINIATASGTNRVKGAATFFLQPRAWNGSNTPGGTSTTTDQRQVDVSLGAPIVKDHLWGFASYRYKDVASGISRTAEQLATLRALVPDYEPFDTNSTAHFWFAKLTAGLSPAHRLVGFYQRDVNPTAIAIATTAEPSPRASGGSAASARVSSAWSDRWLTELQVSYNDKHREVFDSGVDGPLEIIYDSSRLSGGRRRGVGALARRGSPVSTLLTQPDARLTFSFGATYFARHGHRTHELEAGIYGLRSVQGNHNSYVNGGFRNEDSALVRPGEPDSGLQPFHRLIMDGTELTVFEQRALDTAFYAQDTWRPSPRLTVHAGVRIDHIVGSDEVFHVTGQRSTEVGPRLGINYALTRDARNVVRAHWVRVHGQPGLLTSAGSTGLGQRDLYDLDLDGTFETEYVTPPTRQVAANRIIDPDLHQPFVREWGSGYSRQFPAGTTASVDFLARRFLDRPTLVDINGRYEGRLFVGYEDEAFNEIYRVTNNRWNAPVYRALDLSITKRTERLQVLASYVRQWRHMAGTWQPHDPASFIQPEAFANDKGIGSTSGATSDPTWSNSLSGFDMTQRALGTAQWQDHVVHVGLACDGPWGLLLATNYTYQSGTWSGPIVTEAAESDPAFGPPVVTLSNGRAVSNPLATTIRFANTTRGDDQLETPALHAWNVRIGRRVALGRATLDASLDLFNLTNNGADLSFRFGANQVGTALYGTTEFRQVPRSGQIVLRATF